MKNYKVSVVIPCWNSRSLLVKNLINVIDAKNNKKNKIIEIIVVDDASSDDSVEYLEKIKEIKIIKLTKNRGFSGAVNMGVRSAKGNLVCLLNTDVSPAVNFLEKVFYDFGDEKVFGVSLHEKGYGGVGANFDKGFLNFKKQNERSQVTETFWVSGGSGVFNKKIWKELGGFDEKLLSPFYWEDVDICYRAMKRGYRCLWEPESHVLHNHESVINADNFKKKYLSMIKERNELLFYWKNIHSRQLMKRHFRWIVKRVLRHPGYLRVVSLALKKRKDLMESRKKEMNWAKVSDEIIFERFN